MKFNPPIEYQINFAPLTDEADIQLFGEFFNEILKGVLMNDELNGLREFDRVYVNVQPPLEHDILCRKADFQVISVSSSLNVSSIIIRKRL